MLRRRSVSFVRITAGRWKGRKLEVPAGARPTSLSARQALFNMLRERIPGACVLDLYAGSGAVGLEAVSRGAARAVLVEEEAEALQASLDRLKPAAEEVSVIRLPVSKALEQLRGRRESFDLVFSDPPYSVPVGPTWGGRIAPVLAPGGVLILQRDSWDAAGGLDPLTLLRRRAYGRNVFYFYSAVADGYGARESGF